MAADPSTLDIVEAGHRLRARTLTAEALTEACLANIAARNHELRAFITVTGDSARAAARLADRELAGGQDRGPLHGIPIALKDLIDQAGVPTTAASLVRPLTPAASDAIVTARLKSAGAVLIGKTNLHEFALGTTSEDSAFGAVRNPLDTTRSAGGSSGGSAAALVAGMALGAIGTDTGGSIRIPAAACGLVGLKPGFGEVPVDGVVPLSTTLDHVGPLARTVADAAALHSVLARVTMRALQPPPVAKVRLGRLTGYFEELLQPEVRAAYEAALDRLARAGAAIASTSVPHAADAATIYLHICLPEGAAYHAETLERCPERYTPNVRLRFEMGRYILAEDYLRALAAREVLHREVEAALADVDALVLPTLPIVAPTLGLEAVDVGDRREALRPLMLRLTQPFNLSRHPAVALPCGPVTGLPISLQVVGKHARTGALLDLCAALAPLVSAAG
ncbi:MAG: amidase [Vicinamibacteria bacterium]|nr:amidase [Vicinamibacteria bacterium]